MEIFLSGQVPAQKNQKRVAYNRRTGKPFVMSSKSVKDWQADIARQLSVVEKVPGTVEIEIGIINKDRRKRDLDNQLASIMDALKNNNIIEDDNCYVVKKETIYFIGVDVENPGAKISVKN